MGVNALLFTLLRPLRRAWKFLQIVRCKHQCRMQFLHLKSSRLQSFKDYCIGSRYQFLSSIEDFKQKTWDLIDKLEKTSFNWKEHREKKSTLWEGSTKEKFQETHIPFYFYCFLNNGRGRIAMSWLYSKKVGHKNQEEDDEIYTQ